MTVRENLKDRFENIKGGVEDELGILRQVFQDVKGRVLRGEEPQLGRQYNLPGRVGGLCSTAVAIPVATLDNVERHLQESGRITRRWFRK